MAWRCSFKVTLVVTLISLAVLVVFWFSAFTHMDFSRWALNIGVGPDGKAVELPEGNGSWFPFGFSGVLATLPFAVWLFLAIEQLPLAAEESVDPQARHAARHHSGLRHAADLGLHDRAAQPIGVRRRRIRAGHLARAAARRLPRHLWRQRRRHLGLVALTGLIASFHTILYAQGRQIYSLSRAGYFPAGLSVTHPTYKTPHVAMITGALVGLLVMLIIWFANGGGGGGETQLGDDIIGTVLLNMAVFGAMLSYIMQAISFILLRRNQPDIERPFRSPLGIPGAVVTIVIAVVTLCYQIQDPNFSKGVIWVVRLVRRGHRLFRAHRPATS